MATSYNGWKVIEDRDKLVYFVAGGQKFYAANADVAAVGQYLIQRFNDEVEALPGKVLDDWSWAVRPVRDSSTSMSCHASATAWDLNALIHVRGIRGTFTLLKQRKIRKILAGITDFKGNKVIRWGADYSTTVDDMHFEVNASASQIHEAALKIRALQEDEVKQADIDAIVDAVADRVIDRMFNDRVIPNENEHGPFTVDLKTMISAINRKLNDLLKPKS